jgi:Peptidase family M28
MTGLKQAGRSERLREYVNHLAGEIGVRNGFRPGTLTKTADYISACWTAMGYSVVRQQYEMDGLTCENLEASRPGRESGPILVIGAHYDTVARSPGANDNGSGVAVLIELARLFRTVDPTITVRFVSFVNEEPPHFGTTAQGSVVYARAARERGDDIRLMLALETLGYYTDAPGSQHYPRGLSRFYPNVGNFLAFVTNLRNLVVVRQLARLFRSCSDFPLEYTALFEFLPGVDWSDHRSFWRERYRAVMVTDTAFYRYPYYHTAEDTPDKLCYASLARVTDGLFNMLVRLGEPGSPLLR